MQSAFSTVAAAAYIGSTAATLKNSRCTGNLWGVEPPKFTRIGTKKIIYRKTDLDNFLDQFDSFHTTAQASMGLNNVK